MFIRSVYSLRCSCTGYLSVNDFRNILDRYNYHINQQHLFALFRKYDRKNKGYISFVEFSSSLSSYNLPLSSSSSSSLTLQSPSKLNQQFQITNNNIDNIFNPVVVSLTQEEEVQI